MQWVLVLLNGLLVGPEIFIKNQLLTDVFTYKYAALLFKESIYLQSLLCIIFS